MLYKKCEKYCADCGIADLLRKKGSVIVALSGGADSSVLLSFFASLKKDIPSLEIFAAHVNHMIRGEEADRDEDFCESLCASHGISLKVRKTDVPALAKESGESIEECARNVRYSFFRELSEEYGALVATAHNADDNLETVIFNLTRGSGTKGMSGIAPIRDGIYIRPLLSCTGEEIRTFAKSNGIGYVVDSTNTDTAYTRNSIRHNIIPLLKEINPKVCDAALRLSHSAREDCEYIENEALRICEIIPVSKDVLSGLSPALFSRVIRLLYKRASGKTENLSEKNISDSRRLCASVEGGAVSLPCGYALFCDKDGVFVDRDSRYKKDSEFLSVPIFENTPAFFSDFTVNLWDNDTYIKNIEENIYKLSLHATLDCDKISGDIFARNRLSGDTFLFRKVNRKLKKFLCDEDVPRHIRDSMPIICDESGILAIPFVGQRDNTAPDKDTKQILHIIITKK